MRLRPCIGAQCWLYPAYSIVRSSSPVAPIEGKLLSRHAHLRGNRQLFAGRLASPLSSAHQLPTPPTRPYPAAQALSRFPTLCSHRKDGQSLKVGEAMQRNAMVVAQGALQLSYVVLSSLRSPCAMSQSPTTRLIRKLMPLAALFPFPAGRHCVPRRPVQRQPPGNHAGVHRGSGGRNRAQPRRGC